MSRRTRHVLAFPLPCSQSISMLTSGLLLHCAGSGSSMLLRHSEHRGCCLFSILFLFIGTRWQPSGFGDCLSSRGSRRACRLAQEALGTCQERAWMGCPAITGLTLAREFSLPALELCCSAGWDIVPIIIRSPAQILSRMMS